MSLQRVVSVCTKQVFIAQHVAATCPCNSTPRVSPPLVLTSSLPFNTNHRKNSIACYRTHYHIKTGLRANVLSSHSKITKTPEFNGLWHFRLLSIRPYISGNNNNSKVYYAQLIKRGASSYPYRRRSPVNIYNLKNESKKTTRKL